MEYVDASTLRKLSTSGDIIIVDASWASANDVERARAAHEERDNTVDSLAADYVQLACLCLDEGGRRAISPRLMETVSFFLFSI